MSAPPGAFHNDPFRFHEAYAQVKDRSLWLWDHSTEHGIHWAFMMETPEKKWVQNKEQA